MYDRGLNLIFWLYAHASITLADINIKKALLHS